MERINLRSVRWLRENLFNDGDVNVEILLGKTGSKRLFDYLEKQFDSLTPEQQVKINSDLIRIDLGRILLLKIGNPAGLELQADSFSLDQELFKILPFPSDKEINTEAINNLISCMSDIGFSIIEISSVEPLMYDTLIKVLFKLHGHYKRTKRAARDSDKEEHHICLTCGHADNEQMKMIKSLARSIGIKVVERLDDEKWKEEIAVLLEEFGYDAKYNAPAKTEQLTAESQVSGEKASEMLEVIKDYFDKIKKSEQELPVPTTRISVSGGTVQINIPNENAELTAKQVTENEGTKDAPY